MNTINDWYVLEVLPECRSGRGRFWRPHGAGYTDDPACAGVYAATDSRVLSAVGTYRAIPLLGVIADLREQERAAAKAAEAIASRAMDAAINGRSQG